MNRRSVMKSIAGGFGVSLTGGAIHDTFAFDTEALLQAYEDQKKQIARLTAQLKQHEEDQERMGRAILDLDKPLNSLCAALRERAAESAEFSRQFAAAIKKEKGAIQ